MTDKKSSESRRKLLKSVAAGSGAIVAGKSLPESWSRPVVDSVLLPVHAQTSGLTFGGTVNRAAIDTDGNSLLAQAVDALLPEAHAGAAGGGGAGWYICATVSGGVATMTLAGRNWNQGADSPYTPAGCTALIRRGTVPMDGTKSVLPGNRSEVTCPDANWWDDYNLDATVSINPDNSTDTNLAVMLYPKEDADPFELSVPVSPGGCPPEPPQCDYEPGCPDDS